MITPDPGDVTATVTTPSQVAPANGAGGNLPSDQNEAFMARVVAWPGQDEQGQVNLHWQAPGGRGGMPGRPFKQLQDFMDFARSAAAEPDTYKEIYFCLSTQRTTGKIVRGHPVARRDQSNAHLLKALWLDVDVKSEKGYATRPDAVTAIQQFCTEASLPPPSALVCSGGGLHVYWISSKPLTVAEWKPYAEGLKAEALRLGLRCDAGLTANAACVLRVPGTFNNKIEGQPRPVKLVHLGDDYDFANTPGISPLSKIVAASVAPAAAVTAAVTPTFDLKGWAPMAPMFAVALTADEMLGSGVNNHSDLPLDPTEVFKGCVHFQDSFLNHGKGQSQGLWMQTVLASTWFDDGRKIAHTLSKGYPTYTKEETDAMFDRKMRERAERGLGWPGCKAFEAEGAQCKACPFYGKIKSPLNLASRIVPPTLEVVAEQAKHARLLPVARIRTLYKAGADREALFSTFNETYAAVRNGSEVLVAAIIGRDVVLMEPENFHKMFANLRCREGKRSVEVSRLWWEWTDRRAYLGRGVVFEPGGPLEVADDMLNLWRGFGIEPQEGNWSLMRDHMFKVVCSDRHEHFDYLIKWMAYAVQYPKDPIGVAIAFRGAQGAGKGIVARTFGKFFGRHFAHIANGDHLTGRFNASVATSCAVFLDEALWAGDKKGEGVLKALITEPRLHLEAKFRDPIMVDNRLRIMVASNNDWCVPAGIGDRRWFVLDVTDKYAGTGHKAYWDAIHAEIENGGAAALFHDLLAMDLTGFDVRAVPHTAAKAQQQAHSLQGTEAWLYHILQEGCIGYKQWQDTGLTVSKDHAYGCFEAFCKQQRAWRPEIRDVWSKKVRAVLGPCVADARPGKDRTRSFQFAPLADCCRQFERHAGAPNIEWEAEIGSDDPALPTQGTTNPAPPSVPPMGAQGMSDDNRQDAGRDAGLHDHGKQRTGSAAI